MAPRACRRQSRQVTQTIEHSEPAADIADDEAAHFAAEQLAGYIERNVDAFMPENDMDLDGGECADLKYMNKLNRNRKELRHELSTGVSLKLCRC